MDIKTLRDKKRHDFADLVAIMGILRSEGGCPWDREQDHKSIRNNFIEETYEVIEAIDTEDAALLREELGDVLLQVVFHARMEEEKGSFDIDDVADGICKKLIDRHPHIFGDVVAETSEAVLKNWDKIKQREKSRDTVTDNLRAVPKMLPALMRAYKVGKNAAKAGFDFPCAAAAMAKVAEETAEARRLLEAAPADPERLSEELGDLLFSVVNVARLSGVDGEAALHGAVEKFIGRIEKVEAAAVSAGLDLATMSPEEMDTLWNRVKSLENREEIHKTCGKK